MGEDLSCLTVAWDAGLVRLEAQSHVGAVVEVGSSLRPLAEDPEVF